MMKLKGRKTPKKKRPEASTMRKKGISRSGEMNSRTDQGLGVGGRRDLMVRLA